MSCNFVLSVTAFIFVKSIQLLLFYPFVSCLWAVNVTFSSISCRQPKHIVVLSVSYSCVLFPQQKIAHSRDDDVSETRSSACVAMVPCAQAGKARGCSSSCRVVSGKPDILEHNRVTVRGWGVVMDANLPAETNVSQKETWPPSKGFSPSHSENTGVGQSKLCLALFICHAIIYGPRL